MKAKIAFEFDFKVSSRLTFERFRYMYLNPPCKSSILYVIYFFTVDTRTKIETMHIGQKILTLSVI